MIVHYYHIVPIGLKSPILTYSSLEECHKDELCSINVRNKQYLGVVLESTPKPTFECKELQKTHLRFLPYQKMLADFIMQYYCVNLGEAYGLFTPFDETLCMADKDCKDSMLEISPHARLNQMQNDALCFLKQHKNPLLFGDTGSGKTEIYIHLIAQTLNAGQNALFLMPEIALTPQIESRLRAVFGDMVGIWHSKIAKAQKKNFLARLHSGDIRVIAGARSAFFLPVKNLGLIIVDEEHDDAYKSQSTPHYNARDLALYLGNKSEILVILGSATPSVSSYFYAREQQSLYRLKGQYFASKKHIKILASDKIAESCDTQSTPLPTAIVEKIRQKLEKKEQVIVFLPTRAHYKMLICQTCGNGVECDFCSVNMSLHLDKNALICHYCHWSRAIPRVCPQCGSENLGSFRIGTAQVAQSLQTTFADSKIALFDRDNITTHKKLKDTLKAFNAGEIDILVGTQMLSKGHDYHNVNLAVVLGIDYVLKSSDYRCNERAVSLLHQISGRAGRKYDGEVWIESVNGAFLEQFLGDYEDFLRFELKHRPHIYPPFVRLATLSFADKSEKKALEKLAKVRQLLQEYPLGQVEIVGDCKALLERLYDKYRFVLLLRSASTRELVRLLHYVRLQTENLCEIEIDPLNIV